MDTGTIISGAGHGLLLAFLAFGGLLQPKPEDPLLNSADVSLISAEEFAALTRQASVQEDAPDATVAVPEPTQPEVETSPAPEVRPETPPEQPAPPVAETPEPPQETPVTPEAPPPPEAEVADTPPEEITPPAPDTAIPDIAPPAEDPAPRDVPRVAPIPVPEAPQSPEIADTPAPTVDPNANTDVTAEEQPPAAPEEATTEIAPEPERPAGAPDRSPVPMARPAPPTPRVAETPEPAPETVTEVAPVDVTEPPANDTPASEGDPLADAIAGAVAEAIDTPSAPPANVAPAGPPMTAGEEESLRVAVKQCWNLGATSTEAMRTIVVVAVEMNRDGTPVSDSIRLVRSNNGGSAAEQTAYDAARRAIIRCGSRIAQALPPEKFGSWQQIEMTFNPEKMR